jgi:hypothetical protein
MHKYTLSTRSYCDAYIHINKHVCTDISIFISIYMHILTLSTRSCSDLLSRGLARCEASSETIDRDINSRNLDCLSPNNDDNDDKGQGVEVRS